MNWKTLYNAIFAICSKYGGSNAFGESDYWVVDDNWDGSSQKLVVFSPKFLTPRMVAELADCIKNALPYEASLVLTLDMCLPDGQLFHSPIGLTIDSRGVTEEWDLPLLRQRFGESFYTDPEIGELKQHNQAAPLNADSDDDYSDEWPILYDAVRAVCAKYGSEQDSEIEGDYWIMNENLGGPHLRMLVFSPKFLTPRLVAELVDCIASTKLTSADVMVILDLALPGGKRYRPASGLVIYSKGVAEMWNLHQIRKRVGQDFFTDLPLHESKQPEKD